MFDPVVLLRRVCLVGASPLLIPLLGLYTVAAMLVGLVLPVVKIMMLDQIFKPLEDFFDSLCEKQKVPYSMKGNFKAIDSETRY